jgi:ribosomal-protein-alanine N-acetyltransferase
MNQDPQVRKYFPGLLSRKESLAHIAVIGNNIHKDGYGLFAAELKATGEFIGFIGFSHPDFDRSIELVRQPGPKADHPTSPCVEIGWRLAAPFWGQGLATEGAAACLKTAFEKWDLTDIYSFTSIHNQPSENVMIRIGMTRQGTFAHPSLPADSWLSEHVLYKTSKS